MIERKFPIRGSIPMVKVTRRSSEVIASAQRESSLVTRGGKDLSVGVEED